MSALTPALCNGYAAEIEALAPPAVMSAPAVGGSLWEHFGELIAGLKAFDITAIGRAIRDILIHVLPDDPHPMGADAAAATVGKVDWARLKELVMTILRFFL